MLWGGRLRRPGAMSRGQGRVRNGRGTSCAGARDVRYGGNSDGQGRRGQVVRDTSLALNVTQLAVNFSHTLHTNEI